MPELQGKEGTTDIGLCMENGCLEIRASDHHSVDLVCSQATPSLILSLSCGEFLHGCEIKSGSGLGTRLQADPG